MTALGNREPVGKPIPGQTTLADAEWALTKARRFIFRGGNWTPALRAYVDHWLDYRGSFNMPDLDAKDEG